MARQVVFFPEEGERRSPAEVIQEISNKDEREKIKLRLQMLSTREPDQWNMDWVKRYQTIWQMRSQHYRIILYVEDKRIVVLDAFKKESGKTAQLDKQRWQARLKAYQADRATRK